MSAPRSRPVVAAAITLGSVAGAMLVRSILDYKLDERINYATFYVAVIVSALYCGARWGLVSVLLSTLLAILVLPPLGHPAIEEWNDLAGLIIFLTVSGVIVWLCDRVRDHRRAAEELARQRQELLVSERAARHEAERLNHMKDSFLAAVSHDLRAPLQSILGWAELLRVGTMSKEEVSLAVDSIERGVRMQSQLINDLLDLSRINMGKLRIDVRPMALSDTLHAAVQTVLPAAMAKNISLRIECDNRGTVLGDADRLQQVLWNLLSNAIKFSASGGSIRATLVQDDASVSVTIADTGEGIDQEFLPRVFDRFQQAEGKRHREGLGLGLAIVKELVELHSGTVEAHSDGKGRGAQFRIRLPQCHVKAVGLTTGGPPAGPRISPTALMGKQVLVVDDDGDAREVLKTVLGGYGAEVLLATSAAEARDLLEAYDPDVVTCDLDMPEVDGYDFVRSLGAGPGSQPCCPPIVALTACSSEADRQRVMAHGFERHLVKPVTPHELIGALSEVTLRTRPR